MRLTRTTLLLPVLMMLAVAMQGQTAKQGIVKSLSDAKLVTDGQPPCLLSDTENGDPATGPSTFILKAPPGCLVPWHYHTAEEQLIVVAGSVLTEMEGMPAHTLGAGGFAMMPSKAKHQFSCQSKNDCIMFVTFDRVYDIVWLNKPDAPSAARGK